MDRCLENIILTEEGEKLSYTPVSGGGHSHIPERQSRADHASYLQRQLEEAWNQSNDEKEAVVGTSFRGGVYLQFEGMKGYDLITKSLEDIRQHVRLLNVQENDGVIKATVYVPHDKRDFFIKKINKYASTESGSQVVDTIEKINAAMVSALWVGKQDLIPGAQKEWCEVWVRYEPEDDKENFLTAFREVCSQLQIDIKDREIIFPERIVVLVHANFDDLKNLMIHSGALAEIRKMVEPVTVYSGMERQEQREWVADLENRIDISQRSNTSVCLLDSGVNNGHPLLKDMLKDSDMHAIDETKGVDDRTGHGTAMAGIAVFFDLQEKLDSMSAVEIYHYLESVKILNKERENEILPELYGDAVRRAAYIAEAENPDAQRTLCMAVTSSESDNLERGEPSSWSAAIDALLAGVAEGYDEGEKRLMCISAGNTDINDISEAGNYLDAVQLKSIENPGQSWNAITVGAYTEKIIIDDEKSTRLRPVACRGGVSPFSSSSVMWNNQWPVKPDVVFEGGNLAHNPDEEFLNGYTELDDLGMITTNHDFLREKPLTVTNMTSPATAQAAWMLANIQHHCPGLWPETVRGLLIHSAEWSDEMKREFLSSNNPAANEYRNLIRTCGYGIPNLERAIHSARNSVNLIIEDDLQPFIKKESGAVTANEMRMYDIPWPHDILEQLGENTVSMRVTLSYYIEPAPGRIGWKDKYRYPSCGLLFDVNNPTESAGQFQQRISKALRDEDSDAIRVPNDSGRWKIGINNRNVGSIRSDIWEGPAVDLSQSHYVLVYPTTGWWKLRTNLKKYNSKVRYSLIVSIETPEMDVDLYSEIKTSIENRAQIETKI